MDWHKICNFSNHGNIFINNNNSYFFLRFAATHRGSKRFTVVKSLHPKPEPWRLPGHVTGRSSNVRTGCTSSEIFHGPFPGLRRVYGRGNRTDLSDRHASRTPSIVRRRVEQRRAHRFVSRTADRRPVRNTDIRPPIWIREIESPSARETVSN